MPSAAKKRQKKVNTSRSDEQGTQGQSGNAHNNSQPITGQLQSSAAATGRAAQGASLPVRPAPSQQPQNPTNVAHTAAQVAQPSRLQLVRPGPPDNPIQVRRKAPSVGIYRPGQPTSPTFHQSQKKQEDALLLQTKGQQLILNDSSNQKFTGRSGYGTKGREIVLRTNYLDMTSLGLKKELHQYTITFRKGVGPPSKAFTKTAIMTVLGWPQFAHMATATDFSSILITNAKLPQAENEDQSWEGEVPEQHPPPAVAAHGFTFDIKFERSMSMAAMLDALASTNPNDTYVYEQNLIQAFNIIIAKAPRENNAVAVVGSNKFFPLPLPPPGNELADFDTSLGGGLMALRGYFSSVRPVVGRLLLNVNVTSAAFYEHRLLADLIARFDESNPHATTAEKTFFLRNLRVSVEYTPQIGPLPRRTIRRVRTIFEVAQVTASTHTFQWQQRPAPAPQVNITIKNYYQAKYGITLQKETLIKMGQANSEEYFPIEFCVVVQGQQYRQFLTGEQTKPMVTFAARDPIQNATSIAGDASLTQGAQGLRVLNLISHNLPPTQPSPQVNGVNQFGFGVGTELIKVPGRILPTPQVQYVNNVSPSTFLGSWNLAPQTGRLTTYPKFRKCPPLKDWGVVLIHLKEHKVRHEAAGQAIGRLREIMGHCGMANVPEPSRSQCELQLLSKANRLKNGALVRDTFVKTNKKFLFVILGNADRWLYAYIKWLADTQLGIQTICAIGTVTKMFRSDKRDSYLANLALKFNIKTGGTNHVIKDQWPLQLYKPGLNPTTTMLVGIDVTHPSPGSASGAPSIASMVASTDHDLTQWPGGLSRRDPRTEIKKDDLDPAGDFARPDLCQMLKQRLALWKSKNNTYPTNIVIFRDGVSEGQYHQVLEFELPVLQRACKETYQQAGPSARMPKFAIIIVGKRHHTRFYPTEKKDCVNNNPQRENKNHNPLPGTIVDRGIAHRILFEYWLQAHHGLQGSARPAHYVVLKDEINLNADAWQDFTHKLCYLFNRATKAVSICPPAYYADLLADRGRLYLHEIMNEGATTTTFVGPGGSGMIHDALKDTTFYI